MSLPLGLFFSGPNKPNRFECLVVSSQTFFFHFSEIVCYLGLRFGEIYTVLLWLEDWGAMLYLHLVPAPCYVCGCFLPISIESQTTAAKKKKKSLDKKKS